MSPRPSADRGGPSKKARPRSDRLARLFRFVVLSLAVLYPLALLGVILAFRFVGERFWATTAALYVPRFVFLLPLPVLVLALCFVRPRWLLLTQAVAVALWAFPLCGLGTHLGGRRAPTEGALPLRVFTFNVNLGHFGLDRVLGAIEDTHPDLILLQELPQDGEATIRAGLGKYSVQVHDQFVIASRYPVLDLYVPPKIPHLGQMRTAHYVRARLATPAGDVTVYDVHPISPREGLDELHGQGLRAEVASGRILRLLGGEGTSSVVNNTSLRLGHLQAATDDAAKATGPVLIAGDTNLPHASWALAHFFGGYQDAFSEVGWGFGYTFPAPKHPWMRIDRVFASQRFRVLDVFVPRPGASDHLPVVADLELLRAGG